MSQLSNNFNQFYKARFVEYPNLSIQENSEEATLSVLEVFCPEEFCVEVLQNSSVLKQIWKDTHERNQDCDGVAILGEGDEAKYLLLAELKSKLKFKELEKAISQIVMSYLKMHSLFSLCKGYNSPLKLEGIIACSDDDSLYSTVYNQVILGVRPNLLHYVTENPIRCRLLDIMNDFGIKSSGLSEDILRTPVTLHRTCSEGQSRHNFTLA